MSESDTSAKCLVGSGGRYDLFRYDRDNRKGGGVAIFCKRVLNPVRLNFPEDLRAVEAVCIELTVRVGCSRTTGVAFCLPMLVYRHRCRIAVSTEFQRLEATFYTVDPSVVEHTF